MMNISINSAAASNNSAFTSSFVTVCSVLTALGPLMTLELVGSWKRMAASLPRFNQTLPPLWKTRVIKL